MRLLLLLPLLLLGCSVEPPLPLDEDPELAALSLPEGAPVRPRLAVAPVLRVGGEAPRSWLAVRLLRELKGEDAVASVESAGAAAAAPIDSSGVAAVGSAAPLPKLPPLEITWRAPVDELDLQARVAAVVRRVHGEPASLSGLQPAGVDPRPALLAAAEAAGAELLLELEVGECRTAWVDRDGFWFWFDAFMFWVPGIYPIVLVSDEVYETAVVARARIVHVRSGRELLARDFVAREVRSLNDPERGWSLTGLMFLYPWTLDAGDLPPVHDALWPHARRDLERQLGAWLARDLPPRLSDPQVVELLTKGSPDTARTVALVVGAPGPTPRAPGGGVRAAGAREAAGLDRPPPLTGAASDAEGFARLLRESGEVSDPANLVLLRGPDAVRSRLLGALPGLGKRMLGGDRLVVYVSGYGLFDPMGRAALLLDGELLLVDELASAVAAAAPAGAPVLFVLDASFAGSAGRSYPSAGVADPEAALVPLQRPGWQSIVASGAAEPALEGAQPGGALTAWLLAGASGQADEDGDGAVTLGEAERHLGRWLVPDVKERTGARQRPRLLGDDPSARFVRVPPPG